jgi:ribosomal protein RSM22 (predicted rRNA methylase)
VEIPKDLREAIEAAVAGVPIRDLTEVVDRLIGRYRTETAAAEPILGTPDEVAGYAAYRMPATFAAVRSALGQLVRAHPGLAPRTQLDLGGGTGGAVWAASAAFGSLAEITALDHVAAVLAVGRRIASVADSAAVRGADWRQATVDSDFPDSPGSPDFPGFPGADLVTVSYVLSELSEAAQDRLVRRAASAAAELVVLVEPGTPRGYARIMAARTTLIGLGFAVLAPCPHSAACPLVAGKDWCHFGARVNRSGLHRKLKAGELSYEDEKFSFVAAGRTPVVGSGAGRVVRRPAQRKGLVSLAVCTTPPAIVTELVSKRQGDRYRAARDVDWGDPWP